MFVIGPVADGDAQLAPIARDFVDGSVCSWMTAGAHIRLDDRSVLELTVPAILDGCRIIDASTMFIAFMLEGMHLCLLFVREQSGVVRDPIGFRVLAWARFTVVPGDVHRHLWAQVRLPLRIALHGERHGGLVIPLANVLTNATGSWHAVFYVAAILIAAALMALLLKPMRIRDGKVRSREVSARDAAQPLRAKPEAVRGALPCARRSCPEGARPALRPL